MGKVCCFGPQWGEIRGNGFALFSDSILDTALQIAEALSLSDDCAGQLAQDERLFGLACQVVRLSANEEVRRTSIKSVVHFP